MNDRESTKTISTKTLMVFHQETIVKIGFGRLGYTYIYICIDDVHRYSWNGKKT